MSEPLVLVTGAAGRSGSAVVEELRARDARVRALVRREDRRSARLAALGAEVVAADVFDPLQVRDALAGVTRLYHVPPWHPFMIQSAVVVATAARAAGVEAVVGLSQWLAHPTHPSLATRQNWLADRLFDLLADTVHVTLDPGFFADNYVGNGLIGLAAQLGVLPAPLGRGRNAPPSTEDIARVAAAVLLDPAPHAGRTYRPTGPALLTPQEIADAVGVAVGRPVRYIDVPPGMFLRALAVMGPRTGIDAAQMAEYRWYYEESRLGTWERGAPTSHVRDVTGSSPEEFATIAQRYAARPEARRSAANLARALWDVARIGVTPEPRLDRLVRRMHQPVLASAELAARSPVWSAAHSGGSADGRPRGEVVGVRG